MERKGPFVLAGILFLVGITVGQDDVVRTKAEPAIAPGPALSPLRPAKKSSAAPDSFAQKTQALASYSRLPLSFEPNQGQSGSPVKYLARGGHFNLFFTRDAALFAFGKQRARPRPVVDTTEFSSTDSDPPAPTTVQLRLLGANPATRITGVEELPGKANYLVGRDPSQWHVNLPTFAKVRYRNVYRGVDLLYYGNQGELESDFIIAPGANPEAVKLSVVGAESLAIDSSGDLVLRMKDGELRLRKPFVYQQAGDRRREIAGSYVLTAGHQIGFRVSQYDHKQPLIIDPVLSYSTYLGTATGFESGDAIAVDTARNAYIAGDSPGTGFPNTTGLSGGVWVVKLSPSGTLVYSTLAGGTAGLDFPTGIGVDAQGNAYVQIDTSTSNLFTSHAIQTTGIGSYVFALNPGGSGFNYASYLSGIEASFPGGVAVDSTGNAYFTGQTSSFDFPIKNPFQAGPAGGGMFAITSAGANWTASSSGLSDPNIRSIAVDPSAPSTIYVGTGAAGVFKSTDSGTTWTASSTGLPASSSIYFLAVDRQTPANVYALRAFGLFKSTDHGATWTALALPNNRSARLLAIDPVTPTNVYVAASVPAGQSEIFKSADGGSTWTQLSPGLTGQSISGLNGGALIVDPIATTTLYLGTTSGGVFKSMDGGLHWAAANNGLSTNLNIRTLAIDPSSTHLYAVTPTGGVFRSTDGAGTWNAINNGLPGIALSVPFTIIVDPSSSATVYLGTNNAGVFKSTDNGSNWAPSRTGMGTVRIFALAVDPTSSANVFAGSAMLEAYVTKLDSTGGLVYSSFLGGGGGEAGFGMAVDSSGNAYVTGFTNSLDFPTKNAYQASYRGGGNSLDGFVTKINAAGSAMVYSTYLGGSGSEFSFQTGGVATDSQGNAYVTGETQSTDFPTLNPTQSSLAGAQNAYVAKFDPNGALLFSTYLGGEGSDAGNAITATANPDGSTSAWIAGQTTSQFFPLANPIQFDAGNSGANAAFVSAINFPTAGVPPILAFSTYLGGGCGSGCDTIAQAIGHDDTNNIYVAGLTASNSFPTVNPLQPTLAGSQNAFIAKIGATTSNADISLTLNSFGPNTVDAGGLVTFSVTVTNNGPDDAPNVALGGRGGANLNLINCTPSQGICGDKIKSIDRGFAELGTLKSGASATVVGVLQALSPCGVTGAPACPYLIEIDARTNANDPNPGNNSATTNLTVNPGADLAVSLNQSPSTVPGVPAAVTYTAVVDNLGPSNASNITAVFSFVPAAAVTSATVPNNCGPLDTVHGTVTCNIGPIAAGKSTGPINISATVNSVPVTATVVVSNSPEADPDPTNNAQSVTTALSAAGVNNAELNGHYTFVVRGFDVNGVPIAIGASFNADGAGNITGVPNAGVMDINSGATGYSTLTINPGSFANQTGSFYSIGPDNRGQLTLNTSDGVTRTFDFDVGLISSGVASMGFIISRQNNSSAPASLSTGLLGYWQFNGNGNDSSGRGNTVNPNGTAGFGSGLLGQGLSLNGVQGTNASMTTNNTAFDFGSGDFTIQVWAKLNTSAEQTLLEKFSGANGPGWSLTTAVPGAGNVQFYTQGGPILNSPTAISTGVWQQIIVQRSGSTWNLFLNGNTATPAATATLSAPINPSTNPLLFGARNSGDGRNLTLNGVEDEVAIWNRALTTAEIGQLWNSGAGMAFGRTGSAISGVFKKQDTTAFALAALDGDWAFLEEGQDGTGGRFAGAGRFTLNSGNLTLGSVDFNDAGVFDNGTTTASTLTGSFNSLDTTNGRVPVTTTTSGNPNPSQSAVYIVSGSEVLFMSIDAISASPLYSGSALRQDTTTFCPTTGNCAFTNKALNGNAVIYEQGNSSTVAGASRVEVGALTFAPGTPTGIVSGGLDVNDGGNIRTPSDDIVLANYSVAPNGRVTITGGGGGSSPFLYTVNTNQAFVIGSDSRVNAGAAEPQVGPIMFTSGFRSAGTQWPAVSGTQVFEQVQAVTATSNTTADFTSNVVDFNSLSGGLHENVLLPNFVVNYLDPVTGRFSFTDAGTGGSPRVGYFVNSSRRITINADPTVTTPFIIFSEPQNIGSSGAQPDLAVNITANPSSVVTAGGPITYTVTVSNARSTAATGVVLDAAFSPSLTVKSVTASQGACATGSLATLFGSFSCSLLTVTQGTPVTITIMAIAPARGNACTGNLLGCITVTSSVSENEIDANPADNSASTTITILPGADIGVLLSEAPTPGQLNGPLTYTAVVFNVGPSPASAVTFTDPLPAGLSNITFSSTLGTCTPTTQPVAASPVTINCSLGAMNPGAFAVVIISGTLTTTPLVNTVTVSNPEADPDPTNNSASVTTSAQERLLLTDSITSSLLVLDSSNNSLLETAGAGTNATGVAVSPNRRLAFVGNLNATYISVIDLTIGKEIQRIQGVRASRNLALTADGSLLVVPDLDKDDIAVIDTNTLQISTRIPLDRALGVPGAAPGSIGVASVLVVGTLAFVDNTGASSGGNSGLPLAVVDLLRLQANQVNGTSNGGFGVFISSLAATPDGSTVVAIRQSPDTLWIVNPATNSVSQTVALTTTTPFGIAVTPNGSDPTKIFGYLVHSGANGPVASVVDLRPSSKGTPNFGQIIAGTDVALPFGVNSIQVPMAVSRDGTRLAIATLAVTSGPNVVILDTTPTLTSLAAPVVVAGSPFHAGASPSSIRSLVYALADNGQPPATAPTVTGVSSNVINNADTAITVMGSNFAAPVPGVPNSGALVRIGKMNPIAATNVTSASLSVVVPQNAPAQQGADIIVTNPVPASGMASIDNEHQSGVLAGSVSAFTIFASPNFHPLNQVLNANFGDATVSLLDLRSKLNSALPASLGAMGVAVTPDGQYAYVTYYRSSSVQAINLSTGSVATIPLPAGAIQVGQIDAVAIAPNPATGTSVAFVPFRQQSGSNFDLQVAIIDANPNSAKFNTVIGTLAAGVTNANIPGGIGVAPDGKFVYANETNDGVGHLIVFDVVGNTPTVLSTATLGVSTFQPEVYVTPDGASLLLADVSANVAGAPAPVDVFDISASPTNPTLVKKIAGTAPPGGVAPSFGAYRVVTTQQFGTQLFAYDAFQQLVQAFKFDPAHSNFAQLGSYVIPGHPSEFFTDLGVTPDGLLAYTQQYTDDAVAVLDAQALASGCGGSQLPTCPLITKVATGLAPSSLAISPLTVGEPDLSVTIAANPSAGVTAGGGITYTVTVSNARSTPATGVMLTTMLSPALAVNSVTPGQGGSCTNPTLPASIGSLTCNWPTVNQGTPVTVTIGAVAPAGGNITANAAVTENEIDFNPTDNSFMVITPVVAQGATSCTGTTTHWLGGNGNWSDAAMWSTGVVPNSTSVSVCIDNGNAVVSQVTVDINVAVGNLYVDSDDSVIISNNTTLVVAGNISNAGQISLNASANPTFLQMAAGQNVTLTGGGTVTMATGNAIINQGSGGGSTLTNLNNTIQGAGQIGNNGLALVNQSGGIIDANAAGATLLVNAPAVTNAGLLEATGGGTLQVSQVGSGSGIPTVNNAGGTIAANGSNSSVQIAGGTTIQGGTLNTLNGGVLGTPTSTSATLDGSSHGTLTNAGTYAAANASTIVLVGTITNTGAFQINAAANPTFLQMAAGQNVTLTGGGTVTMATGNAIINQGSGGGSTLTNVNNTIQGAGQIGNNGLALVNQSGGIINANAAGATLIVNAPTVTNAGLLEATGGGALQVSQLGSGSGAPTVNNAGGTIAANGGNSAVQIAGGATIQGGTLNTLNGGMLGTPASTSATLDGSSHGTLTNAGTYTAADGSTTVLVGTITNTNTGAFLINAAANPTFLQIAAGQNVTLTGGGTVTMVTGNAIINQGSGGGSTLTNVNNTIQGQGQIGNNGLALVNQGTILANATNPLVINPGGAFTNSGTLQANSGSTLNVSSATANTGNVVVNTGGTIILAAGFTQTAGGTRVDGALTGGVVNINAGTLSGNGGTITASANLAGVLSPGDTAGTAGLLTINGAYSQTQTGAYNVDIGGRSQFDQVNVTGSVSLNGALDVNLINGFIPAVGDSFTIMTAGSLSGTFANVNLPPLSGGRLQVTYNPTSVVLAVVNPVPTTTTLSPSSALAGGAGFTLTVNGTNFVSGSTVNFNGNPRTTTFVSTTQLTAAILASDIGTAGTASVTVTNPAPGGSTSNAVTFTVSAAADLAVTLSESPTPAVGGALTYTANITNRGPSQASNVTAVLSLVPAAAASFVLPLPTGCTNSASGTLTCTIGPMNPGTSDPVSVTVTVNSLPIVAAVVVTNTPEGDPDLSNNYATVSTSGQSPDTSGTDFWLTFPRNYDGSTATLSLFITGNTNTTGTVAISSLSFSTPFMVTAGQVTTVSIPFGAELQSSDVVENFGIHVTAQANVTVYGLDTIPFTTDAYLGLPTGILGTEYVVLAFPAPFALSATATQFAIVGTADGTMVTVTPSVTVGARTATVPYSLVLNQGQTYQLSDGATAGDDLTGTIIASDKPIAVFGGNACADVPNANYAACNYLVEELPPTQAWGKTFYTVPLATRTGGDTFRFLASTDGTHVSVNGAVVATLNRGQVFQQIITTASQITADQPILVAQYSNGQTFDGASADPFMILVTPAEQYLASYTITTPASGFSPNYVNIVARTSGVGTIQLDGTVIAANLFTPIGTSGFSGAQVPLTVGSHTLTGLVPFGTVVYGFASFDGYGYPGGFSLSPVALVSAISLAPKTATYSIGSQACVVATVTDQNGAPVSTVRVDFTVTGANSTTGFANTGNNGQAQFCYAGAKSGADTVKSAVGAIFDTATVNWNPVAPTISKSFGAASIPVGGSTSLSFTLTNPVANTVALTGVGFTDTLPAGLVVTTPNGLSGSCGGGTITAVAGSSSISLSGGTLATNSSCNFSVSVTGVGSGFWVNTTGNVISSEGGAGNAATASITVLAPDLTISKTHSGNFTVGANGVYTLTVTNLGNTATTGTITVTDTLPTGLGFVSGTGAGWSCSANGQVVTCTNPGPIAGNNGASMLTLTVNVANDAPCIVTNTATVSGGGELNTANDTADDITSIGQFCVSVAVVQPADGSGTTVKYAVIITNRGPSDASGLDLNDQLTGAASFDSVSSETMKCPASSPPPNPFDCTMDTLPANSSATATIAVKLNGAGWDGNTMRVTLQNPPLILTHNATLVEKPPAGGNTVTGSDVAVQPPDRTTGASPAVLTFASVTRGGTTTLASAASGPSLPSGFRTGTPAVFYNLATSAGYSGAIGVALGFNGASFHHPAKVRLFHSENGAWVDSTVAVNPAGGYAVALVSSLSPFALFEPLNQVPVANAGPDRTTTATGAQGGKVTLDGSASFDPDRDPLTYRWTGPFPEGNGVVTGVNPTVTMPLGGNRVTLVVNDSEADSAPVTQTVTVTDFSVTAAAAGPTTISAGGSARFNITASPQFGPFPAAVTLACLGLPQGAQCSFSSTTVNAGGPAAMLTITTTPRTTARATPVRHGNRAPLYALWMPLPAIALAGLGARRRARKHTALLMLLLLLGMMLLLVSCGGGSMGSTPQLQNGTPAGTFTITVTGTANGGLQHQTTVSFTVQ